MRKQITKTKMPFAVSMMLIFSYSLFMALVPPTVVGQDDAPLPLANTPDAEAASEQISQVNAETTSAGSASRSMQ